MEGNYAEPVGPDYQGAVIDIDGELYPLPEGEQYELSRDECVHPVEDLKYSFAGAPGTGRIVRCPHCGHMLENSIRVLEPWEVE